MMLIRRVVGESMSPTLPDGRVIIAMQKFYRLRPGNVVIVVHEGREKIKRLMQIKGKKAYLLGDNAQSSTDSRSFGWVESDSIVAKVLFVSKMPKHLTK